MIADMLDASLRGCQGKEAQALQFHCYKYEQCLAGLVRYLITAVVSPEHFIRLLIGANLIQVCLFEG